MALLKKRKSENEVSKTKLPKKFKPQKNVDKKPANGEKNAVKEVAVAGKPTNILK